MDDPYPACRRSIPELDNRASGVEAGIATPAAGQGTVTATVVAAVRPRESATHTVAR